MKKLIVKVASILCGIACVATAAGCAGGNNPNGDGTITNPWWTTTGTLEKDGNGNVVFDNVDVKLTTVVNGDDSDQFNAIVQKFNEEYHNKIKVTVTPVSENTFESVVTKQISYNTNAPDLMMSHQKSLKSFAINQLIQPFNETIEASGITFDLTEYADGLTQYSSLGYTDMTFGIPIDAQTLVVYYNRDLLTKYGGKLPASHSELLSTCAAFKTGENNNYAIALSTTDTFTSRYLFMSALIQNGGTMYNDGFKADWYDNATNRAAFNAAIGSVRDLSKNGYVKVGAEFTTVLNDFLQDKSLFLIAHPWEIETIAEAYAKAHSVTKEVALYDKLGASSMAKWFASDPAGANAEKLFGDSHFFTIPKTVKSIETKAAICEFVKWYTQNTEANKLWANAGHLTAYKPVAASDEYKNDPIVKNYTLPFYNDINQFYTFGISPYWSDTFDKIATLFNSVVKTETADGDVDGIIKSCQDNLNVLIDLAGM